MRVVSFSLVFVLAMGFLSWFVVESKTYAKRGERGGGGGFYFGWLKEAEGDPV